MDNFKFALIIIGIIFLISFLMSVKVVQHTNSKLPLFIYCFVCMIGIVVIVSLSICLDIGEHLNTKIAYTKYDIDKIDLTTVYFNNEWVNLNSDYLTIEQPDDTYTNYIVKESESYEICYIINNLKITHNTYHLYLDEDTYNRLKDKDMIYKRR